MGKIISSSFLVVEFWYKLLRLKVTYNWEFCLFQLKECI